MGIPDLRAVCRIVDNHALCGASLGPRWASCGSGTRACASGCREQAKLHGQRHNPSRTRNHTGKLHGRTPLMPYSPQQKCSAEGMASSRAPVHLSMLPRPHGAPSAAACEPVFLATPNTRSVGAVHDHTCCRSDDRAGIPNCCNRRILPRTSSLRTRGACTRIFGDRRGPRIRGACDIHRWAGTAGRCECVPLSGGRSRSLQTDTRVCSFAALGQ
mmetsp:Transcript_6301/g.10621  ORF Transcript_6301/g.10621 Transcript_6301/m.10621 type:complete len:215 (-) Transcript_6301:1011-1655(-)